VNLSLGELEALCRKAARGAGFDWGPAEEAGRAVRRLAAVGLPGPRLLLARLAARDGTPARELSPRSFEAEWRSGGTALCPILAGASLADTAARLGDGDELVLHDVIAPLLVVPFAATAARQLGRPVAVAWAHLVATTDGETLRISGALEGTSDECAERVGCRTATSVDDAPGEPLPRVTRARIDHACLARLDAFAQRTYAPATEASRSRGAGGASTDDD